jgi:hypothetical protein
MKGFTVVSAHWISVISDMGKNQLPLTLQEAPFTSNDSTRESSWNLGYPTRQDYRFMPVGRFGTRVPVAHFPLPVLFPV